ncbi:conserved Plasmodium protein, unknown function [Plasmodium ovale]|uniref:Peptidylprolyl isomerase n=2 Tax=Plasmodium ovale TaxID=36330 RepID=A0A1A8VM74_PLAOA|nr:conserved Plasmodium protein, unknown function [Plasmodium ovale curtisi]SBS84415.1 conserved Plasmodium protein, unknown function [Plasmodium ovale curtisi]SCP03971.1 conserved Plasmodium protein, unknown function [Plasmodium ovale]
MRLLCFFLFAYYILHIVKSNDDTYISLTEYEIKNKFSVRVLKKSRTKCGLGIGDKAEIQLRTFSPVVNNMPHMTSNNNFGYAEQTFIVGEHNVSPLNGALHGMCVGELRRIGILIGNMGKIYYEVELKDYTKQSQGNDEL